MRVLKIILTLSCASTLLFAGQNGKISGTVVAEDGTPLSGANVIVEGTSFGAASDEGGKYYILAVPTGTYAVRVDYIGYRSVTVTNVRVSSDLTTDLDFQLAVAAVPGEMVEIVAERPIINKSATNTTRIIDSEIIGSGQIREVENFVALQTGTVSSGGGLYVRGSRVGDIAYYVDGVYTVNPFTLGNTSVMSIRAMEELSFQSGGFNAEFGNANGGIVNTISKSGGNRLSASAEFLTDLGGEASEDKDALHSYGNRIFNFTLGGPLGSKIRYFAAFEQRNSDDASASTSYYPSISRTEVADSAALANVLGTDPKGIFLVDTVFTFAGFEAGALQSDTSTIVYHDYKRLYGAKPNAGLTRNVFTGNLLLDLKPLRIKVGGSFSNKNSRGDLGESITMSQGDYPFIDVLTNTEFAPRWESSSLSAYANFTLSLTPKSFIKLNLSYYVYKYEYGDDRHWDNFLDYGDPKAEGNEWLRDWGANPLTINEFASFNAFGDVFDEYRKGETDHLSLRGDYLNQIGTHEVKVGVEIRNHTIRDYRLAQPMEIGTRYFIADKNNWGLDAEPNTADDLKKGDEGFIDVTDPDWIYKIYRNAYTMNIGYDQQGVKTENYKKQTAAQAPGKPFIMGAYLQDKIELDDLILNVGVRLDYYDFNTEAPKTYDNLFLTKGRIDRDKAEFKEVETYTYISPRIGFSFPVTDRTVFHAQYGQFVQHPILNRLYLSDSRLAANLTQGNMTESPNATLKPERTTQYEVGFAQQIGDFAAVDVTGYYKEIRDYTLLANRLGATIDGAEFIWAQFMNGDYGVVKGVSVGVKSRRVLGILADVNYTSMWASGTGSDPSTNFIIAWIGENYPKAINPFDYDQRHTGSVMVDYRGAKMLGLFDLGGNVLYTFGSGTAYTPSVIQSAVFGRDWYQPVAAVNSSYRPWTSSLDLKIDFERILGTGVSAFIQVKNALNTENVVSVYPGTGQVDSDGWLKTAEGQVYLKADPTTRETFYTDRLSNQGRWSSPRMVLFGLTYNL
ncbi:MAG: carboxypeptidase regulatory-like domain-containing protein [Candidatus Marinimicrobia bacterium]|nr:carboxypeptidase regulatory-like domain-containing protein [Candidatus Neomarinimicrobiota bacterium]